MPSTTEGIVKYIPTVSETTLRAFHSDAQANPIAYGQRSETFKNDLIKENPNLCRLIASELSKYPPELHTRIFGSIINTLLLIATQARADQLSSTFTSQEENRP